MQNAVTPQAGENALVETSAQELVRLAETADGWRDEDLLLVRDGDGKLALRKDRKAGDNVIGNVRTTSRQPGRAKVSEVTCKIENYEPITLSTQDAYDAIFWTESAVEKFLYPYYHTQRLWDKEMEKLKEDFEQNPKVVAIAHKAPSKSSLQLARPVAGFAVAVVAASGAPPGIRWMSAIEYLGKK